MNCRPSNFEFIAMGESESELCYALRCVFETGTPVMSWKEVGGRLLLFSTNDPGTTRLLSPSYADDVSSMAYKWARAAKCPERFEHDGSCHEGWRVTANNQDWSLICAIEPFWMEYYK
jgi:hypothetical protein